MLPSKAVCPLIDNPNISSLVWSPYHQSGYPIVVNMSRNVFPHLKSVFVPRKHPMLTTVVTYAAMKVITGSINIKKKNF